MLLRMSTAQVDQQIAMFYNLSNFPNEGDTMMPSEDEGSNDSQFQSKVLCVSDVASAQMIRLVLAMNEIRAAVIQREPLRAVAASAEILVAAVDLARAEDVLEDVLLSEDDESWNCPTCGEAVPANFDVCWNCGDQDASNQPMPPSESSFAKSITD